MEANKTKKQKVKYEIGDNLGCTVVIVVALVLIFLAKAVFK